MIACTFFGRKDTTDSIEPFLRSAIEILIIKENVKKFYVGNQGNFDLLVLRILEDMKSKYPEIDHNIVLAYRPVKNIDYNNKDIYPLGIETVPKRFSISWRNIWMIKKSDFVITYVSHSWGGAAKFQKIAEKQNKTVINLYKQI